MFEACTVSPDRTPLKSRASGLSSDVLTKTGPMGQLLSRPLPRHHWEVAIWSLRAETSFEAVNLCVGRKSGETGQRV